MRWGSAPADIKPVAKLGERLVFANTGYQGIEKREEKGTAPLACGDGLHFRLKGHPEIRKRGKQASQP